MESTASHVGNQTPRLELRGITKTYAGVTANRDVSLDLLPGDIHAVLGENGAGKSTLMKVAAGVVKPDAGTIRWEGRAVRFRNPAQARALGIGMVFQQFSLFETLTVAENVALALPGRPGAVALAERVAALSRRYGLPLDPFRPVHALSTGERQRVEIMRALMLDPTLLILDEPTSVLAPPAVRALFEALRRLAAEGCSIVYVSHKLDEIRQLCTRATVLRAGRVTGRCDPRDETPETLARMMIGRELPRPIRRAAATGDTLLELVDLQHAPSDPFAIPLMGLRLTVRAGEVVGVAGVSGNGQRELVEAISGEAPVADPAAVRLCGVHAGRLGPADRRALGLCVVPEERLGRAAVASMSLAQNGLLTAQRQGQVRRGFIRRQAADAFVRRCIDEYDVRCAGPGAEAQSLSGGNLQKLLVGREVLQRPRVIAIAQPTAGVDVGASAFIRQAILDLRGKGVAILVVSEDLDELFELSDRIAVMARGQLSPALPVSDTSVEQVGLLMAGACHGGEDVSGVTPAREEGGRASPA
jgi:simple sugar transport system ATP-binding protein